MSKPTFLDPLIGDGVGQCELVNAERGSVLASHVEPAFDSKTRKRGLLGRESVPDDYAMILAPCNAIHTFFMRTAIDLVFVNRSGVITKTRRSVPPWRVAGDVRAYAVIEAAPGFIERHDLIPGETVAVRENEPPSQARASSAGVAATPPSLAPPPGSTPTPGATPAPGATPSHPRRTTGHRRATLSDIIAGRTPLAWFESLAIVQELGQTVVARGPADDLRVPELKHIALRPDGSVKLLSDGPSGHSPVQRAGLVLLALTPEDLLPMQLRLFILEEVSPRPKLRTLQDLLRELEFFERPDRRVIVQQVCERFLLQSAQAATAPPVPPPLLEPPPPKRLHHWWRRRSVRVGGAALLLALAAAAIWWAWPRPEAQWLRTSAKQASVDSKAFSREMVSAVRRELESARWKLGFRPKEPEKSVLVLVKDRPSDPKATADIKLEGGAVPPPVPAFQLPKTPIGEAAGSPRAASPPVEPAAPGSPAAADAIFSAADPGVVPPRHIRPQPGRTSGIAAPAGELPEVELLVSRAGEVESVKLISPGRNAKAGMQLSAVKAWQFTPAMRNGEAVRYRLRVRLPAS